MAKSAKRSKRTAEAAAQQTKKQIALGRKQARQNRIIYFSVGALLAIIVTVLGVGILQELVLKPAKPVALVNDAKIRTDDYQALVTYNRYNQYISISNLQGALQDLQASPEENEFLISFYEQQLTQLQSSLELIPDDTLEEIISDELIRQKAEQEGIVVDDEDVSQAIDEDLRAAFTSTAQDPITGTEEVLTPTPVPQEQLDDLYKSVLENRELSDKSFRTIVQSTLLRAELQELFASQVPTTGLVINVQIIETETEDEAAAAMERIESGEEFAIVAQEVSTDTTTAESGGDLGWVTTGQLSSRYGPDLETAAFSLEPGSLALVESNEMFYVILVADRDENGPLPSQVLSTRQGSALSDWLDETRASPETDIERLLEPDQIPSDPFALSFGF